MRRELKILIAVVSVSVLLLISVTLVVLLLRRRESLLPQESSISESEHPAKVPESLKEESYYILIDEDATGYREDLMLQATNDFCKENGLVGNVTITDIDYIEGGDFVCTIENDGNEYKVYYNIEDYSE